MKSRSILFFLGIMISIADVLSAENPTLKNIVVGIKGNVSIDGKSATMGESVSDTSEIQTGSESFVRIQLKDQSLIIVSPQTQAKLGKYLNEKKAQKPEINIINGAVRAQVIPTPNPTNETPTKLRIRAKSAIAGVRGTDFRVFTVESADRVGVLNFNGVVTLQTEGNEPKPIRQGEYSTVDSQGNIAEPVKVNPSQLAALAGDGSGQSAKKTEEAPKANQVISTLPPGMDAAKVFGNGTEAGAPSTRAGGFIDLSTGVYIPPPPGSNFDPNTNMYIPSAVVGNVDPNTGAYIPPKGFELTSDGKLINEKGQSFQVGDPNIVNPGNPVPPGGNLPPPGGMQGPIPGGTVPGLPQPPNGMLPPPPPGGNRDDFFATNPNNNFTGGTSGNQGCTTATCPPPTTTTGQTNVRIGILWN